MTLRIHNIMYDHSQEFRTYPAGVITIDALTRAIHVHDGLTPNGWEQPTRTELGNYALKDLTNVTQESMNNALNTFGALNMNNADQVSTTQRDNAWTKLFGPAMLSNADIPGSNYLYVDKKDRKMKAGDLSTVVGFGMDVTKKKNRQAGVTYKADTDCYVVIIWTAAGETWSEINMTVDGVRVLTERWMHTARKGGFHHTFTYTVPVAKGQTYSITGSGGQFAAGIESIIEYPVKHATTAPTTEG